MHFFIITVGVFFNAEAGMNSIHSTYAFPHYNSSQTEFAVQYT
jgi:hypothetical protein